MERNNQMTIFHYDLNELVDSQHVLRKVETMINFKHIANDFNVLKKDKGRTGYGIDVALKALFLQFYYDMSDRQIEDMLRHNMAFKWFCGFKIDDATPDHTFFCRTRKILGTERVAKVFRKINKKAEDKNILKNIFTFVDASKIISKQTTWSERDKALEQGEEALNNDNVKKYSSDKQARFGCNGKNKFWYGYKRHNSTDMSSGLIKKVAVTPANISDAQGLKHTCPKGGMVFADKGYCTATAQKNRV
jgi:IS5 family transposase